MLVSIVEYVGLAIMGVGFILYLYRLFTDRCGYGGWDSGSMLVIITGCLLVAATCLIFWHCPTCEEYHIGMKPAYCVECGYEFRPCCDNCKAELQPNENYCANCGEMVEENIDPTCPECGEECYTEFCGACGARVGLEG